MTFKVKDGISIAGSAFVDGSRNITAGTISGSNATLTGELRGPATFVIDPAAVGDNTGTVVIKGDLQVDGTTTTLNSTTITVDDINIELGSVASPSNATANGGGIILKGTTDKTFIWSGTTLAWESSEHIKLAAGKTLQLSGSTSGTISIGVPAAAGSNTISFPAATGTVALTSDIKDPTITLSVGSGLTGGGSFTLNQASTGTISFDHADTSTAANLTASSRTYVTGLTFDTYGHVTGYTTATETVTDTNTVTRLRGTASGTYTSGDLTLLAGTNVTISQVGTDYTISASQPTVGAGTLGVSIGTAGATNTTVTWGTSTGFNANTATNYTYDLKVGPALTNLATLMTTAGAGFIKRGATADTYTIDTNTYLTSNQTITLTGDVTGSGTTSIATTLANSGVTAGSYNSVTVDAKGRTTAGSTTLIAVDSRSTSTTPQTINMGVAFDFKQNTTEGLSDGGTYFGEMTFRQYGSGTDWSGGASHQLGFTDNGNIWQRSGTSTTWGSWKKLWDSSNLTNLNQLTNGPGYVTSSGVTAVTGTAPIVSSGGTTPAISITAATSSAAGSMSAADKAKLDGIASGATANTGTVTSIATSGTVSGITLTGGTITTSGTITLGGTLSASIDNITDEHRLWNNFGDNHGTRTSFDAQGVASTVNFGWRYVQGSTNGPGIASATQYYSQFVGLGNDYGYNAYGMQLAIPRVPLGGTPYLSVRFEESGAFGAWQKIYAGYADSAGSVSSIGATQVTNLYSPNGATVVSADASTAMPSSGQSLIHTLATGPAGNDGHVLGMSWANTTSVYGAQIWLDTDPTNRMAIRSRSSGGAWNGWSEVITANNIGSYSSVPTFQTLAIDSNGNLDYTKYDTNSTATINIKNMALNFNGSGTLSFSSNDLILTL